MATKIDQFLQKEQIKWGCPDCGGPICVHRGFCLNCMRGQKTNWTMWILTNWYAMKERTQIALKLIGSHIILIMFARMSKGTFN